MTRVGIVEFAHMTRFKLADASCHGTMRITGIGVRETPCIGYAFVLSFSFWRTLMRRIAPLVLVACAAMVWTGCQSEPETETPGATSDFTLVKLKVPNMV